MNARSFITGVVTIAVLGRSVAPGEAGYHTGGDGLKQFLRSVDVYVELVQRLERDSPSPRPTDDPHEIHRAIASRAEAIRHARATAREGELFNPEVGALFRSRLDHAFSVRGCDAGAMLREMSDRGERWRPPIVNDSFSWRTAAATPSCVLAVLPVLPRPLQFRFVGPDLVLLDVTANLIVDVLPDAVEHHLESSDRRRAFGSPHDMP